MKGLRNLTYYSYPYGQYHPYFLNPLQYYYGQSPYYWGHPYLGNNYNPYWNNQTAFSARQLELKDYGKEPFVIDIEEATTQNTTFRTALWTGDHFQITLMSLNVGEDIGLEMHPNVDQFLRIEQGEGVVQMGDRRDQLNFVRRVYDDYIIVIPAGKWHNLTNTGNEPLKLYSIYAPPNHPFGTVHETKKEAMEAEEHHE